MSNQNQNLKIWESVSETDVAYTKHVTQRGGYTSICATYQSMKATEMFGPYGKGWGLESITYDFSMLEQLKMVICNAVFFYTVDDKRISFPINNAINPMMGVKPDEDFCKKVETNTISKALSKLGFSADVFMGLFDDNDYLNQIKTSQDIEKATNRDEEVELKKQEAIAYIQRQRDTIANASTVSEVVGIAKVALRHLSRQKLIKEISEICERGERAIQTESEAKKAELIGEVK